MVPKIIHLCWFSGDEYPDIIRKCIDSWQRVLPDFEIKIWTREMALETNIIYVREAISVCKWAFAADVIRLWAVYHEGGVYMDSDIYILQRFDTFMENKLAFFQEYHESMLCKYSTFNRLDERGKNLSSSNIKGCGIQAAFFMGEPGNPVLKEMLDYYMGRHFIQDDNTFDIQLISPDVYAKILEKYGYCYVDKKQELDFDTMIYPSHFVAGGYDEYQESNFAVHCVAVAHSWCEQSIKGKIIKYVRSLVDKALCRPNIPVWLK